MSEEADRVGRLVAVDVHRLVPPAGAVETELGGQVIADFGHAIRVQLNDGRLMDLADGQRNWRLLPPQRKQRPSR